MKIFWIVKVASSILVNTIFKMATNLGFSLPQPNQIIEFPQQENIKLAEKKQRLLTELAAIENGLNLFDWLNPERNTLQTSVTDVPCGVELLSVQEQGKRTRLDMNQASNELSEIIEEIGSNPTPYSYNVSRPTPTCEAICNHAHVFFSELRRMKESRIGLSTPFGLIHPKTDCDPPPADNAADEDNAATKRVHPFFPDIKGIRPLLGHMKQQLGEFPNFIKNPPDDEECEELRMAQSSDCYKKHILEICGSSSDDEFNPDSPLETLRPPIPSCYNMPTPQRM